MSSSRSSDEGNRATNSADATGSSSPNSPSSKIQTAWQSVKTNFKGKTSMPDLKRWLSSPRVSESNSRGVKQGHPEDEEQSLFCESLLGLMQRTDRFTYLDYRKDGCEREERGIVESSTAEKERDREKGEKGKDRRRSLKRFSWSR